ncbi:phosphoadenylyl-sulfate reductase [Profundibacter sp.]|uniref:phosphoadenylyl-sulfate reductase n=1 Tax=Profundibacter sp. TaxID=3101071 RepID=UPI003D135E91
MLHNQQNDQLAARWNRIYQHFNALEVLEHTLGSGKAGRVALVSSFGAESVMLLHMLSRINPHTPVLFIDTQMLFTETLEYQLEVTKLLGLTDVRTIRATAKDLQDSDPDNRLHKVAPDNCCDLRKTRPLQTALADFDTWITGRKRHHSGFRTGLEYFGIDGEGRVTVNPLIHWGANELNAYMDRMNLPRHPLLRRGYTSIGCAPCTSRTTAGEPARAGRWRGNDKQECGIHFMNGKVQRPTQQEATS